MKNIVRNNDHSNRKNVIVMLVSLVGIWMIYFVMSIFRKPPPPTSVIHAHDAHVSGLIRPLNDGHDHVLCVVPGGGGSGSLPPWTKARLHAAIEYYRSDAANE
jgi:hypothetical protein